MSTLGTAFDAWRLSRKLHPERAWRTDPRMHLVEAGGHRLRILDGGSPARALERPATPVLFAADAPVVLEHYAPVLSRLAPARRAIALEMPGFGFSTPAPSYRFTLEEQVEALKSLLDALDLERATLAFSCVNALVALALAARHPERVDKLVLAQAPSAEEFASWAARIDVRVLGRRLFATPLVGQAVMWAAPAPVAERWFRIAVPNDGGDLARTSRRVYSAGGAFCLAALLQSMKDLNSDDVGHSHVPTTIVWGDQDRTHKKTDKTSSRTWTADVRHFATSGHCPDLEQPEEFARLL